VDTSATPIIAERRHVHTHRGARKPLITFAICRELGASVAATKLSVVMAALPSGFFGILFGTSYRRISDEANSTIIASTIFSALTLAVTIGWTYSYNG
jgi:malonate transporter and related proteins